MKPKTLILMVIAVGCGLGAAVMTQKILNQQKPTETQEEKVAVLVARNTLSMGTATKEPDRLFEVRYFNKGEEPKRAIKEYLDPEKTQDEVAKKLFDQVKDRRLKKQISAEQFIFPDDLMDQADAGLSAQITKGMRAIGVKVDTSAVAGGFVLPNSRVDVVFVQRKGDADSQAKVILQNVLVLAVGTQSVRPEDKQTLVESTVTLSVTPEQAEKLTLASEMGTLRLLLRSFGDEDVVKTTGSLPKNLGKSGDNENATGPTGETEETSTSIVGKPTLTWPKSVPDVKAQEPVKTADVAADVKTPEPTPPKIYTMVIINGESTRKVKFISAAGDDNTETVAEIQRSAPERPATPKLEPAPAPPAPPATAGK